VYDSPTRHLALAVIALAKSDYHSTIKTMRAIYPGGQGRVLFPYFKGTAERFFDGSPELEAWCHLAGINSADVLDTLHKQEE